MHTTTKAARTAAHAALSAAFRTLEQRGEEMIQCVLQSTAFATRAERLNLVATICHYTENAFLCLTEGDDTIGSFADSNHAARGAVQRWEAMHAAAEAVVKATSLFPR